jgi:hypothetical protein
MQSRYRQIVERYQKHLEGFMSEKLSAEEAELLASQLTISEIGQTNPASPGTKEKPEISHVKILDTNIRKIKKITDFTLELEVSASNGKVCLLELEGEQALRIMIFLKFLFSNPKNRDGYSEEVLQDAESSILKSVYIDLEYRSPSTGLHRSMNQKLKRRTGIKELIKNSVGRRGHGQWVLLLANDQIDFIDKNHRSALLKL